MSNVVNGYVLDPHDENSWADNLLKIIEKPKIVEIMGKNGKQVLASSHNEELYYKKILNMCTEVLQGHS